jgi:hypothetical protein
LAKSAIRKQNVFTMQQFLECMNSSDYVTAIEAFDYDFYDYNEFLERLYKNLNTPGVKKWQIFSVVEPQEGQQLSMLFKTSNRTDAITMNFPIIKGHPTNNRNEKLTIQLAHLVAPGRKDIKQVELYTKFRKFVPEIYQEESCPKPDDEILNRFKIEKTEKIKIKQQKKKDEVSQQIMNIAGRAAQMAIAQFRPTVEAAEAINNNSIRNVRKRSNNDDVVVYEA